MATAAPDLSLARLWLPALLWVVVGGWAFERLPPDGSAGMLLGLMWAAMLMLRWLPWARWGLPVPRIAGLCCPAPQARISDVAMGWMMGTLWWHTEACLGRSAPPTLWVGLHLLGMAALLVLLPRALRPLTPAQRLGLSWCALAAAAALAILIAVAAPAHPLPAVLAMGLLTMAWVCEPVVRARGPASLLGCSLLVSGPVGLWTIHQRWPTTGPDALWQAIVLLGLLGTLLGVLQRTRTGIRPYSLGGSA